MKTDVDIIFIKPGSQSQIYGELSDFELTAIEPPLWGALLAGYLRNLGYSVTMYDEEIENNTHEQTAQWIKDANPLLAAILVSGSNPSASTMNMIGAGEIISHVKQLDDSITTVLAGLHPSALPERTTIEESSDFVCQGEGFYTLPKLIDALKNNRNNFDIAGLWYKRDGRVISNPSPPLMEDISNLPRPAWDLLPMKEYRAHNWHCFTDITNRQPYAVLYTSLGCPFKCSFCCINSLFGKNTIRYRGIESIINELDFLVTTYNVKNIKIIDEMFALHEKRIVELCNRIIERKYDLNIWAYARVNTVTEKMLTKMKAAGINWLAYGFESGSRKVLSDVTKNYKMELVDKVVKISKNLGFFICSNFIFGLPQENYESMNETFQLMFEINAEWNNIYCAMAYPGSHLYRQALENKWPLPQTWDAYSQYSYNSFPLPSKHLSSGQILAFRDYAFHAYYENPSYLHKMNMLFGTETVQHIKKMTKHRIKRKHT